MASALAVLALGTNMPTVYRVAGGSVGYINIDNGI